MATTKRVPTWRRFLSCTDPGPIIRIPPIQKVARVINSFACDLFQVLSEKESSNNIFFSPMSISTALVMTFMGARGDTASQMSKVLHLDMLEESDVHHSFGFLRAVIHRADTPYILKTANRLFGHKDLRLLPAFVDGTKKHYGASMETLDFVGDGEGSRRYINSWVEKETENRIKDLLAAGSIDAFTRLVLVNAIYFKAAWEEPFLMHNTKDEKFYISETETIVVPMMHQTGFFPYARDDSVSSSILKLPYVDRVSLFVVLPDKMDGLNIVQKNLSLKKIETWMQGTRMGGSRNVAVSLPKFTLHQDFVLSDVLKAMGMADPFDVEKANFSGMTKKKNVSISTVVHQAFLDVNEKGTEAAAATWTRFTLGVSHRTLYEFKADHPFLVFIHDNRSNAILFIGQLCKPTPKRVSKHTSDKKYERKKSQ